MEGKAKSGQMKEGDQRHFHVLIARKTKDEKHKISPLTNHRDTQKGVVKGGFERVKFAENIEKSFDKHFKYERSQEQSFQYRNEQKKGIKNEDIIKQQQELKDLYRRNVVLQEQIHHLHILYKLMRQKKLLAQ